MNRQVTAVFDGHVLLPDSPLDLPPNTRYVSTLRSLPVADGDAWDVLEEQAGKLDAPRDWASQHDHYLYGIPKRQPEDA